MTALKKIAALTIAAATLAGLAGEAQADKIWTKNNAKNAIWITVYTLAGHNGKKDWYCMLPGEEKSSNNSAYGWAQEVHVRAEVKSETDGCGNKKNKYDMTNTLGVVGQKNKALALYTSYNVGDKPSVDTSKWH
ncbi:hypothetical protein [uncultured Methylobacterium sp.]|uniref:hypothetical protein n=1 Tax=uncultured Methylobacterium sp. TaxID=157278 RepID=UPI0035CB6020